MPLWKTVWWFPTKLNIVLPYDPAVTVLSIYPKELKIFVCTETCRRMFKEALFTIAKSWKQVRCPSVSKWIKKKKKNNNCGTSTQYNIFGTKRK